MQFTEKDLQEHANIVKGVLLEKMKKDGHITEEQYHDLVRRYGIVVCEKRSLWTWLKGEKGTINFIVGDFGDFAKKQEKEDKEDNE